MAISNLWRHIQLIFRWPDHLSARFHPGVTFLTSMRRLNKFQIILSFNISMTGYMSTFLGMLGILITKRDMPSSRVLLSSPVDAGRIVDLGAFETCVSWPVVEDHTLP